MKKAVLFVLGIVLSCVAYPQTDSSKVHWLTFEQVKAKFFQKKKPILVFIYSDDCDSCQMMLNTTFGNAEVAKYIDYYFYPIRFDARSYDSVTFFNGSKFIHQPGQEYHSLVYTFLHDSIRFPALVMFNKYGQGEVFYGFRNRDHIFPLLIYYSEEVYTTTKYPDFEKVYFKAYPPGAKQVITRLFIHWKKPEEADKLMKQHPRKIFIDVYDRYRVTQTIMRLQVYNNPVIAAYLNSHFYPVSVEARWEDTVYFHDTPFPPSTKYPYHTLAIDLLAGKMKFPAFVFLDSTYKLIDREHVFLMPEDFYRLAVYIGDDYYKTMTFKEFLKEHGADMEEKIKQIKKYY